MAKVKKILICAKPDCAYYAPNTRTCDYRLRTGEGRGCAVEGCARYERGLAKGKRGRT